MAQSIELNIIGIILIGLAIWIRANNCNVQMATVWKLIWMFVYLQNWFEQRKKSSANKQTKV